MRNVNGDKYNVNITKLHDQVAILLPELESEKTSERREARSKLESMGTKLVSQIPELAKSDRKQLRWEIAKALSNIKDVDTIPGLIHFLGDQDSDIRWVAAEGLTQLGRASLEPLLEALIHDRSKFVLGGGLHHAFNKLLTGQEKLKYEGFMNAIKDRYELSETIVPEARKLLHEVNEKGW